MSIHVAARRAVIRSLDGFWERQKAREAARKQKQQQYRQRSVPVHAVKRREGKLSPYLAGLHPYRTTVQHQRMRRVKR